MRVLFFIDSLRSGGKERRFIELLFYLKKHTKIEMCVVLTDDTIAYEYVKDIQVPIHVVKRRLIKYDPSVLLRFLKKAKEFRPDIIHTWGMMATVYAIPTKMLLKKPLLANLIANVKKRNERSFLSNFFWRLGFRYADVILSNSKAGLAAYSLIDNEKVKLIYNGVRLERFSIETNIDKIKEELNIKTPYIVIMIASATPNKDYDFLLDVAKYLMSSRMDITFVGVGGGSELERLNNRIKTENIKNLILTGKRNDIETLITIADLAVLFTYSEGTSNSIIEYMAIGKPVITTDVVGGSREIIEEGRSGYILEKNMEHIAAKIINLLDDRELRIKFGKRGKEIVHKKFTVERMGRDYVTLYKKYAKT